MRLPTNDTERKTIRIKQCFLDYFPDAIVDVAKLSWHANEQHNPGTRPHWDRNKSGDELDSLLSHLMDAGELDSDGFLHDTKVAWRAMANLQKRLEDVNYDQPAADECEELNAELKEWEDAQLYD